MPDDFGTGPAQEGPASPSTDSTTPQTQGEPALTFPYIDKVKAQASRFNSLILGMRYMPEFKGWSDDEITKEVSKAFATGDKDAISTVVTSLAKHDPSYLGWTPTEVSKNILDILTPVHAGRAGAAPVPVEGPGAPAGPPPTSMPNGMARASTGVISDMPQGPTNQTSPAQLPQQFFPSLPAGATRQQMKSAYGSLVNEVDVLSGHPEYMRHIQDYNRAVQTFNANPTPANKKALLILGDPNDVKAQVDYINGLAGRLASVPDDIRQEYHYDQQLETPPQFDKPLAQKYLDWLSNQQNYETEIKASERKGTGLSDAVKTVQDKISLLKNIVAGDLDQYAPPSPTGSVLQTLGENIHALSPMSTFGMGSQLYDSQQSQIQRLLAYKDADPTMDQIVKSAPVRQPGSVEQIAKGMAALAPQLPALAGSAKLIAQEIPALATVAKAGVPKVAEAAKALTAQGGPVLGIRVLTGAEDATRIVQNMITSTLRTGLSVPLATAMTNQGKAGVKEAGQGIGFGAAQGITDAVMESLPLPLRAGKFAAPIVGAFAGALGFGGGSALGAAITGEQQPDIWGEMGKGALLSLFTTAAGRFMDYLPSKKPDPTKWSPVEADAFMAAAALRGAKTEEEFRNVSANIYAAKAGRYAEFTDVPPASFESDVVSRVKDVMAKPRESWTPDDVEVFRDMMRYNMASSPTDRDAIVATMNQKYGKAATETAPPPSAPTEEKGGSAEPPSSPATGSAVAPAPAGAENPSGEPSDYVKQNFKDVAEAARNVGIYDIIANGIKEGKSEADISAAIRDQKGIEIPPDSVGDLVHGIRLNEQNLPQPSPTSPGTLTTGEKAPVPDGGMTEAVRSDFARVYPYAAAAVGKDIKDLSDEDVKALTLSENSIRGSGMFTASLLPAADAIKAKLAERAVFKAKPPEPAPAPPVPSEPVGPDGFVNRYTIKHDSGRKAVYEIGDNQWHTYLPNGAEGPTFSKKDMAEQWIASGPMQKPKAPSTKKPKFDTNEYPLLGTIGKIPASWTLDKKTGKVVLTGESQSVPREILDTSNKPSIEKVQNSPDAIVAPDLDKIMSAAIDEHPELAHLRERGLTGHDVRGMMIDEYNRYLRQGHAPDVPPYNPREYSLSEFGKDIGQALVDADVKDFIDTGVGMSSTVSEGVNQWDIEGLPREGARRLMGSLYGNGFAVGLTPRSDGRFDLKVWKADALPKSVFDNDKALSHEVPEPPAKGDARPKPKIGSKLMEMITEGVLPDMEPDYGKLKPDDPRVVRRALKEIFQTEGIRTAEEAESIVRERPWEIDPEIIQLIREAVEVAYERPDLAKDYLIMTKGKEKPNFESTPVPPAAPAQPALELEPPKPVQAPGDHPMDPKHEEAKRAAEMPLPPDIHVPDAAPSEVSADVNSDPDVMANLPDDVKGAIEREAQDLDKLFGGPIVAQALFDGFFNDLKGRFDASKVAQFYRNNIIRKAIVDSYDLNGMRRTADGIRLLGLGIPFDLATKGGIDMMGQKVNSLFDIAVQSQMLRDPRMETVRYYFMDDAGKIVWATSVTSNLPGVASLIPRNMNPGEFKVYLKTIGDFTGATSIAIGHNHPNGDATPTPADFDATKNLFQNVLPDNLEFKGHVIIDDNQFATIEYNKQGVVKSDRGKFAEKFRVDGSVYEYAFHDPDAPDPVRKAAIEHPVIGRDVNSAHQAAHVTRDIVHSKGFAVIMAIERVGNDNRVKAIAEVPKSVLYDKNLEPAQDYLRRFGMVSGSSDIVVSGLSDSELYALPIGLYRGGYISEAVDSHGNSYRDNLDDLEKQLQDDPRTRTVFGTPAKDIKGYEVAQGSPMYEKVVNNENFKKWFEGSKVVDKGGKPLVVYHGTDRGKVFENFKSDNEVGPHFGTSGQAEYQAVLRSADVPAIYRVRDAGYNVRPEQIEGFSGSPNVYPVFLNIKNPLRTEDLGGFNGADVLHELKRLGKVSDESIAAAKLRATESADDEHFADAHQRLTEFARRLLRSLGYDGIVYRNTVEGEGDSYIALNPKEQVKSAIGNRGTFDALNPSIVAQNPAKFQNVDEIFYQKAKPSFEAIRKSMESSGLSTDTFTDALVAKYGERVRPYVERFISEFGSEQSFKSGLAMAGATGTVGSFGRPSLVVVNAKHLPIPENIVPAGKYDVDEHQRAGINLALQRVRTPGAAFLLADGAGVGKTRQELAIAQENASRSGKPSLIVTQNKQIVETAFKKDAVPMKIEIGPNVEVITYDDLKRAKGGTRDYGVVIFDEAHNLKNVESDRSFKASQVRADNRVFATATPMDNAHNAAYFMSQITGLPEEDVQKELGYIIQYFPDKIDPTIMRPFAHTLPGVTWPMVFANIRAMRDRAIERGAMIRREYPFYGAIASYAVNMNSDDLAEQDHINDYWRDKIDSMRSPSARRNYAGQRTAELSRWIEGKKVNTMYDLMTKDLAAGKSVIIVAEGINASVNKGLTFYHGYEVKTPGFITAFTDRLKKDNIPFASVFGDANKADEVNKFQNGEVRVLVMTPKSGGAGINLDDTTGKAPRSMYVATANFSGDTLDQMLYRASRRTTKSPVDLKLIYASGSFSDKRRSDIVARKFHILRNIQAGEDPDVAGLSYDYAPELRTTLKQMGFPDESIEAALRVEQARPIWNRPTPPTGAGPAQRTGPQGIATLGENIANAWKGKKYELVDGVSGFIAKNAYGAILGARKMLHYLGLPQYIGEHVPVLRKPFIALKNAFHESNEKFADVKDRLDYVRDVMKPTIPEKQKIAKWLWRGNDPDVQKYFNRGELLAGLPGLGLPAMTAREADVYLKIVESQGAGTDISKAAMKYFLMNYPLDDEEMINNNWGVYDLVRDRFIIPPPQGSAEESIVTALTPAETKAFYTALDNFKKAGNIVNPQIRVIWEDIKDRFKEPIVDKKVNAEIARRGGYLTQQRHGDYYVKWSDPSSGRMEWNQYELESEAVNAAKVIAAQPSYTNVSTGLMNEPGFLARFTGRDLTLAELMNVVDKLGLDNDPGVQRLVTEWKKAGFQSHTIKRRNIKGYERTYDNAIRGVFDYAQGASRHYMRTKGRIDAMASIKTIDTRNFPYYAKLASDFVDGYFKAAENSGQFLRKIVYVSNLAWSATFAIQQAMQQLITHIGPVARSAGMHRVPDIMARANFWASTYMGTHAMGHVGIHASEPMPLELKQMVDRAIRREAVAGSMIEELAANASRHGGHLYAPVTTGAAVRMGLPKEGVQLVLRSIEMSLEFTGNVTEKYNRILGFCEGYLLGKDRGLAGNDLYRFAENWTAFVNFEYGKLNIPILINQSGMARPILRAFYTFMSFQLGALHQAGYILRKSGDPAFRYASGMLVMLLGYTVSAGILGLPLAGAIAWLYQKITGDTETPEKIITKNPNVPEIVRKITDAGVLALLGMDMRRSLGQGDINPLDISKTVPVQIFSRTQQAISEAEKGNILRALSKSPIGIIPPLRGAARAEEAQQFGYAYGSRTLVAPQNMSGRDLLLLRANITPYGIGKKIDVQRRQYEIMDDRRKQFDAIVERHARGIVSNDNNMKQDAISRLRAYNAQVQSEGMPQLTVSPDEYIGAIERKVMEMRAPGSTGSTRTRSLHQDVEQRESTNPR